MILRKDVGKDQTFRISLDEFMMLWQSSHNLTYYFFNFLTAKTTRKNTSRPWPRKRTNSETILWSRESPKDTF